MKHIFIVGCALIALTIGTFVDATSDLIQEETTPSIPGAEALVAPSPDGPITRRDLIAINIITTFAGDFIPGRLRERRLVVGNPRLHGPSGITISASGDYYITQQSANCISKVDKITDIMTTFAGTGSVGYSGDGGPAKYATLNQPTYTAFDASGNLYIIDLLNWVIRMVDINGDISTVVGTGINDGSGDYGPALLAGLSYPRGIAFDSRDNLYISDDNRIRVVDQSSQIITTVVGTGNTGNMGHNVGFGFALGADLNFPQGMAFDSVGNLWFADSGNHVIRMVDLDAGIIQTVFGTGEGGYNGDGLLATETLLYFPYSVTFDLEGNPIVTDTDNQIIRKIDKNTRIVLPLAGISVIEITPSFGFSGDGGDATLAQFQEPTQVAVDSKGRIFVADYTNDRVRLIAPYMEPIIGTSTPTARPTSTPIATPTSTPTTEPTSIPTSSPTMEPSFAPTSEPSSTPTAEPTSTPTAEPTSTPTSSPTIEPFFAPTSEPSSTPTAEQTDTPTAAPTPVPTPEPTPVPTSSLSLDPPSLPSSVPTATLCFEPTVRPSKKHGKCKADH